MCIADAPDPPEVTVPEPKILHNPFLDEARSDAALVRAMRTGRSSLRVPLNIGLGVGFKGRGASAASGAGTPFAPTPSAGGAAAGVTIRRPVPPVRSP